MTASSIPAGAASGYARYLESLTAAPERGDYYLGRDGAPAEAPGEWLMCEEARERLGLVSAVVASEELRALLAGRRPGGRARTPVWLREAGPDGRRAGGVDVTFSAPKGVSVLWALADPAERAAIEALQRDAVRAALAHLRATVPLSVTWDAASRSHVPAFARELHAAGFVHTTARGVQGALPDPQLHTHVVLASVERADGKVVAVRSRPVFRATRELGAYYRAHLAAGLRERGYAVEAAGEHGRFFRIAGVPATLEVEWSKRTREVRSAMREFRAAHGRDPVRGELRALAIRTRSAKVPRTRGELDAAWRATARGHGLSELAALRATPDSVLDRGAWSERVELALTRSAAIFQARELRCAALEHAPAAALDPDAALAAGDALRADGIVLELADGRFTTRRVRALECEIEQRVTGLAARRDRHVTADALDVGVAAVEQRLGTRLSTEQRTAVERLCGGEHAALLIGPAGTGKGVVLDAVARAELASGREVHGIAIAGRTAQRLAEDAPAFHARVRTLDAFLLAVERQRIQLSERSTVVIDEAAMSDTDRLARLVRTIERHGAALILVGDDRQLPAIGPGGMFTRLTHTLPCAQLQEVRRTADAAEREAWQALRHGNPTRALAHYRDRGALHLSDDRAAAIDRAATQYVQLARELGHQHTALMTDSSNADVDALNHRVQHLRASRGELDGLLAMRAEERLCGHDRVIFTRSLRVPDGPRVENGSRGELLTRHGDALVVRLDAGDRLVAVHDRDLDALRLGYATHVYRQQGATVQRAIVLTGGRQTARETAYVQATRARHGVDWHLARDDLDGDTDTTRLTTLAARMTDSRAQPASLTVELADPRLELPDPRTELHVPRPTRTIEHQPREHARDRDRTPEIER